MRLRIGLRLGLAGPARTPRTIAVSRILRDFSPRGAVVETSRQWSAPSRLVSVPGRAVGVRAAEDVRRSRRRCSTRDW